MEFYPSPSQSLSLFLPEVMGQPGLPRLLYPLVPPSRRILVSKPHMDGAGWIQRASVPGLLPSSTLTLITSSLLSIIGSRSSRPDLQLLPAIPAPAFWPSSHAGAAVGMDKGSLWWGSQGICAHTSVVQT